MNPSEGLVGVGWLTVSAVLYLVALGVALRCLPWAVLVRERGIQHLLFGAAVVMMLMWTLRAGISPGLSIHFVGMTTLTLIFGWDLAICAGTAALIGLTLMGRESWTEFLPNALCFVVIPTLVSYAIWRLVEWRFPKNFFIYLFLCAFLGGGIAAMSGGMTMGALLWLSDTYPWSKIYHEYVRYLPLIMFPEGLVNGIIMTGMMVFHPDWIRTFDARRYIDEQ
ncbi:energy-coupling factor ABC transporter permease [Marinobacterium zhoushanense]|nr:energy-coupling factor ABC transporter permease [Marinobacterium zhoushanense]